MEPNNFHHPTLPQNSTTTFPFSSHMTTDAVSSGGGRSGDALFSTLRHLASGRSATMASGPIPSSAPQIPTLPPVHQFPVNPSWPADIPGSSAASSAWLDQAKLSSLLHPMYGMFQSNVGSNDLYRGNNLSWIDPNLQQAAVVAAVQSSFNVIQQQHSLPPFGHQLDMGQQMQGCEASQLQGTLSDIQSPFPASQLQPVSHRSCSHSTSASTSHTPQSAGEPHSQKSQTTILSPNEGHSVMQNETEWNGITEGIKQVERITDYIRTSEHHASVVPTQMEDLFEFQDFEDLLLDKPSTSYNTTQLQQQPLFPPVAETSKPNSFVFPNSTHLPLQQQRSDELANADMELDRLVSLVARQNDKSHQSFKSEFPPFLSSGSRQNSKTDVILDVPQFTPPDSPMNVAPDKNGFLQPSSSNNKMLSTAKVRLNGPSASSRPAPNLGQRQGSVQCRANDGLVLIPSAQIKTEPTRPNPVKLALLAKKNSNKVPIYKQKRDSFIESARETSNKTEQKRSFDAYNIEEEFEEKTDNLIEILQGVKNSAERNASREAEPQRVKRKYTRHSSVVSAQTTPKPKENNRPSFPSLADQIRRRRRARGNFLLSAEVANDDNAAVSDVPIATCTIKGGEVEMVDKEGPSTPPLPKLVIRIPRKDSLQQQSIDSTIELDEQGHKKKKRKKRDKDVDWMEEYYAGRHGKKHKEKKRKKEKREKEHKKQRRHSLESLSERPSSSNDLESPSRTQTDNICYGGTEQEISVAMARLHFFEQPTERPRRGTFLLPKEDIFKLDCALWRIDNQNLLQKYLPVTVEDGSICYKNSSTYSGWCEQYVNDYVAIKVEYIKQSRSENVVRPLVALQELLPAINSPMEDDENNATKSTRANETEESWSVKEQQFRANMNTFVVAMIRHAISLHYIQFVKQNNEWNYICALTEVESRINTYLEQIQTSNKHWTARFIEALKHFPHVLSAKEELDLGCDEQCQSCSSTGHEKGLFILQLFMHEGETYDKDTLAPKEVKSDDPFCGQLAVDFHVCSHCEASAMNFHKTYHSRFAVFKGCEEKLELVSTEHPELGTDEIVEKCMADKRWMSKMTNDLAAILRHVNK